MHIAQIIANLDAWFDSMRNPMGYAGPVVHWWQNSLQFAGAAHDWRYEGIIAGYLNLYQRTEDPQWLNKAKRAGNDLLRLEDGNFRHSSFELNPYAGGTPHEAACDIGLLLLAKTLQNEGQIYLQAAEQNLQAFYIQRLWDGSSFRENPSIPSFVPNKAATLVEALFLLAELTNDEALIEQYVLPTLQQILTHQTPDGAIYQYSANGEFINWLMPYYVVRAIPALLLGYQFTQDKTYETAAQSAFDFAWRYLVEGKGLAQIVYPKSRVNSYPIWIAAVGDVLRIARLLQRDVESLKTWLLAGIQANGSIRTAYGFASAVRQHKPTGLPDFRDVLPVCGWSDKAFRYLTEILPAGETIPSSTAASMLEVPCSIRGKTALYREDQHAMALYQGDVLIYRWCKGQEWAETVSLDLLWK